MGEDLGLLAWALAGVLLAAPLACVPGLHVYNLAALVVLAAARRPDAIGGEALALLLLGLVIGYAQLGLLPAVFLGVPDESLVAGMLPAGRYLALGRGYEAIALTALGGAGGLLALVVALPLGMATLRELSELLRPHLSWSVAVVTAFVLMSEWPRGGEEHSGRGARLLDAWSQLLAGLATFALAGLLGLLLNYGGLLPPTAGAQPLMPAFLGLFAVPGLLLSLAAPARLPPQHVARTLDASRTIVVRGLATGVAAGLFGAFMPLVTGGMAGLLAGHATAQRDERAFLVAQGACRAVYYAAGYLLFFVPGLGLTRGGLAWLLAGVYVPRQPDRFWLLVAGTALAAPLATMLALLLAQALARVVARAPARRLSGATLLALLAVTAVPLGLPGLLILAAATGVGLLPPLWGTRRLYGMGVLLVPMLLDRAGLALAVVRWIGLL